MQGSLFKSPEGSGHPRLWMDNISWAGAAYRRGGWTGRLVCAQISPHKELVRPRLVEDSLKPAAVSLTAPVFHPSSLAFHELHHEGLSWTSYFRSYRARLSKRIAGGSIGLGADLFDAERYHCMQHLTRASSLGPDDLLFCTCARIGSPRRTHPCHLEEAAFWAARAGWDVVLYGRLLTWDGHRVIYADSRDAYDGVLPQLIEGFSDEHTLHGARSRKIYSTQTPSHLVLMPTWMR